MSAAGLARAEDWITFFSAYPAVVLVANSEDADVPALRAQYGDEALFVFFNKVYKVLAEPFDGEALLVARSSPAGANIVYRREVDAVLRLLRSPGFRGILNLKVGEKEVFSPAPDFGGTAVGHLDLGASLAGFYPDTHVATSGFALAFFLAENMPSTRIVLAGFTARRSAKWRLFHDHDWTFEQIVQRLLIRSGRLEPASGSPGAGQEAFGAIAGRIKGVSPGDVSLVASEVLAERLEVANIAIDGLLKLTRMQQRLDGWMRRLKPATRKEKLAREPTGRG